MGLTTSKTRHSVLIHTNPRPREPSRSRSISIANVFLMNPSPEGRGRGGVDHFEDTSFSADPTYPPLSPFSSLTSASAKYSNCSTVLYTAAVSRNTRCRVPSVFASQYTGT